MFVFSAEPGWEVPLADELGRVLPGAALVAMPGGWITADLQDGPLRERLCIALARQTLPSAEAIAQPSITRWSAWFCDWLIERLAGHKCPWRCHVFANRHADSTVTARRAELIAAELEKLLRKKQRRLLRTRIDEQDSRLLADEWLVQLGLVEPDRGFVSCCEPGGVVRWRHCLSRFSGGMVDVRAPREAPSRAVEKLMEAELRFGRQIQPGETCVDLGASPGSWSWHALARGAHVVAVDRSPLRDDLMRHPRLEFVRGDAFAYRPEQPLDWLLCDVIAFPQRTLELLTEWLAHGWCRQFCVTIKFRGNADYAILEEFKAELFRLADHWCLRHFTSNKNEVMAVGRALR